MFQERLSKMIRIVLLLVGLCVVLAGCSWTGSGGASSGPQSFGENGSLSPSREAKGNSLKALVNVPITVRTLKEGPNLPVKIVAVRHLRCSQPSVSAACRAIRDFLLNYEGPSSRRACFGGSHLRLGYVVEVYGRAGGRLLGTAVLTSGRCRFAKRWVRDLRTVTGLSST